VLVGDVDSVGLVMVLGGDLGGGGLCGLVFSQFWMVNRSVKGRNAANL